MVSEYLENKKLYIDFCRDNNEIPLFHQPWWLDIVTNKNWQVVLSKDNGNNIKASMPYSQTKKYGLSLTLQPVLTPYLGISLFYPIDLQKQTSIYSFQNKHIANIIDQLPKNSIYQYHKFLPDFDNWYPFFKNNFSQSVRYTYTLNGIKNHAKIYNGFSNTIKRQIKEAKNKVKISEEKDLCLVFTLVKESLQKQKVKFPVNRAIIKALEKVSEEKNQGKIFIARDLEGNINSGLFLVWDHKKAYLIGLGTQMNTESNNSTKLLIWEGIKYASQYVDTFDFEGSMIPRVERLYRNFGGTRTSYFEIKKYKNRFIKAIFAILNK